MERKAGVLLPISSLPGKYGIGDFGVEAIKAIDIFKGHAGDVLIIFAVAFRHSLLWLPSVGTRSWCFAARFNNLPYETSTLHPLGLFTTS